MENSAFLASVGLGGEKALIRFALSDFLTGVSCYPPFTKTEGSWVRAPGTARPCRLYISRYVLVA